MGMVASAAYVRCGGRADEQRAADMYPIDLMIYLRRDFAGS
jgi:hypothetical protein